MVPVLLCGLSLLICMWCPATYYPMGRRERVSQKMTGLFLLPHHPTTVSVTITSFCCTPSCDVHSIMCSGRAHSSIPQEHHPSPEVVYTELACSFSPVGIGQGSLLMPSLCCLMPASLELWMLSGCYKCFCIPSRHLQTHPCRCIFPDPASLHLYDTLIHMEPRDYYPMKLCIRAHSSSAILPLALHPPLLPLPVPAPGSRLSLAPQSPVASTQVDMMALKGDNVRVWMKVEAGRSLAAGFGDRSMVFMGPPAQRLCGLDQGASDQHSKRTPVCWVFSWRGVTSRWTRRRRRWAVGAPAFTCKKVNLPVGPQLRKSVWDWSNLSSAGWKWKLSPLSFPVACTFK